MRRRTKAREYALQLLYQLDLSRTDAAESLDDFWAHHLVPPDVRTFATALVQGTLAQREAIDKLISSHADNWEIKRMAVVDRNILRLGIYELLHVADVPPKVSLNESVELAKRFGDEESSKFVNGILDAIHKMHPRPSSQPTGSETANPPVSP